MGEKTIIQYKKGKIDLFTDESKDKEQISWGNKDYFKTEEEFLSSLLNAFKTVAKTFESVFGKEIATSIDILILPAESGVVETTIVDNKLYLLGKGGEVYQYAYQFGHGLCRLALENTDNKNLLWFTNAICSAAGLYFINAAIGELKDKEYASRANHWISLKEKEGEFWCGKTQKGTLEDYIKINSTTFLETPHKKFDGCFFAKILLPIIENSSSIWQDLLLLKKIPTGLSFEESLKFWRDSSNDKASIDEIIYKFTSDKFKY